jgi:hypothetical protein
MIRAKARPERWKIFTILLFLPHRAPRKRKTIHKKWIKTKASARSL